MKQKSNVDIFRMELKWWEGGAIYLHLFLYIKSNGEFHTSMERFQRSRSFKQTTTDDGRHTPTTISGK